MTSRKAGPHAVLLADCATPSGLLARGRGMRTGPRTQKEKGHALRDFLGEPVPPPKPWCEREGED